MRKSRWIGQSGNSSVVSYSANPTPAFPLVPVGQIDDDRAKQTPLHQNNWSHKCICVSSRLSSGYVQDSLTHDEMSARIKTLCPDWLLFPDSWMEKPAFGTALEEHLKRSNREIALPLEACVMMLLETGMKEEVQMQLWEKERFWSNRPELKGYFSDINCTKKTALLHTVRSGNVGNVDCFLDIPNDCRYSLEQSVAS